MVNVYGMGLSGNCYKVKLCLELLQKPYNWIEMDTRRKETKTDSFLSMNPDGKIPLLQAEDGRYLPESNAILCYLAAGTRLRPDDVWLEAQVLRWMFFEQYSHEPYIAVNRALQLFRAPEERDPAKMAANLEAGNKALAVMEQTLLRQPYLAGDELTIADISLFAYTHVAEDGGFNLNAFPAILSWIERIQQQDRYIAIG